MELSFSQKIVVLSLLAAYNKQYITIEQVSDLVEQLVEADISPANLASFNAGHRIVHCAEPIGRTHVAFKRADASITVHSRHMDEMELQAGLKLGWWNEAFCNRIKAVFE